MRGFWSLTDTLGLVTLPTREVEARVSASAREALRAAGVLRDAPPATAWPCDEGAGCAREVREDDEDAEHPLVAVCPRAEGGCEPIGLTRAACAQSALSLAEVVRTLRELFDVDVADKSKAPSRVAWPSPDEPMRLGPQGHGEALRDVFFAPRASPRAFAMFLATRERVERATLVLVPTGRFVEPELAARHAPGAHVEVVLLEDAVGLHEGAIALTRARPRLRVVHDGEGTHEAPRRARGRMSEAPPGLSPIPRAASWDAVDMYRIDGHTIRISVGKKSVRRTYTDLGMAKKTNREPLTIWQLLNAICEGNGILRWQSFGQFDRVKVQVSKLRDALKELFGLTADPLPFERGAYRAKFGAHAELPGEGQYDD